MRLHRTLVWTVMVLAPFAREASSQEARGALVGYLAPAGGQSILPVLGVPGAAVVGGAVDSFAGLEADAVSPRANYVLVRVGDGGQPALWLPGGQIRKLDGVPPGPDRIAVSPEGSAAAFYCGATGRIVLVAGLPDAPAVSAEIQLNPSRPAFQALAISDDAQLALAIEDGGAVAMSAVGDLNRVTLSGPVEAIAFASGSHDALVAGGGEAVLVRNVEVPGERIRLAVNLQSISAAAVSRDGRRILLASADAGKVVAAEIDPAANAVFTLDCACRPDRLVRMNDDSSYALTGYTGGTLYMLDAARTPRIVVASPTLEQDKL